jgi:hypothetical protein
MRTVFNPHLTSPFDKLRTAPDLGGGIFGVPGMSCLQEVEVLCGPW